MSQNIESADFSTIAISAVGNPWLYIGSNASILSKFSSETRQIYFGAQNLANQVRNELVSEAQRYQAASQLWSDLRSGLSSELSGMRGKLGATEQRWADKAVDAMQSAYVLDDMVNTRGTAVFANAMFDLAKNLGGMVAAAQLIYEVKKSDENGNGPTTNDMAKAALGLGLGILFSAVAGASLPAIAVGALVGMAVDVVWDAYSPKYLSKDFRESRFFDVFFDFFTGKNVSGQAVSSTLGNTPDPLVKTIRYIWVDPLVLDLDGDGIEITPLANKIQFDTNGDGIKTGTAWVQAHDGLLVWDRNGNGLIDSGRELFGHETLLANGQKAAHGFAALSELDVGGANGGEGDGVFDAKDAQYANLRIWRDLNQDGIRIMSAGCVRTVSRRCHQTGSENRARRQRAALILGWSYQHPDTLPFRTI